MAAATVPSSAAPTGLLADLTRAQASWNLAGRPGRRVLSSIFAAGCRPRGFRRCCCRSFTKTAQTPRKAMDRVRERDPHFQAEDNRGQRQSPRPITNQTHRGFHVALANAHALSFAASSREWTKTSRSVVEAPPRVLYYPVIGWRAGLQPRFASQEPTMSGAQMLQALEGMLQQVGRPVRWGSSPRSRI